MRSLILFMALVSLINGKQLHPLSNEMIDHINSLGTTWQAGRNFDGVSVDFVKRLLGVPLDPSKAVRPRHTIRHKNTDDLPESFDSREAWSNCSSIRTIRDQGNCGSCWAFSAVEAMTDRLCIHKGIDVPLSTEQMVTCADLGGCGGGWPASAYDYYQKTGLVTGGLYHGKGCLPYSLPPCDHHEKGPKKTCPDTYLPTPPCVEKCVPGYDKTFEEDKYYGQEPYSVSSDSKQIMKEIMTNGPVSADFSVFADFPAYKSGVYKHVAGEYLGGHAIKIIGWGTENGSDYWLVANSWNEDFGDKGYFKIARGTDECGIESDVVAGLPM